MEFDQPTVEQLLDAAVRLRDELDDETDPDRDALVSWPWIPVLNVFDFAHRLGLVRAAELPEQPISRDGARRKLDHLLPLLRAQLPCPRWSRRLSVSDCRRVLALGAKAVTAELQRMAVQGRAEKVTRQAWRLDLQHLDAQQVERYDALRTEDESA